VVEKFDFVIHCSFRRKIRAVRKSVWCSYATLPFLSFLENINALAIWTKRDRGNTSRVSSITNFTFVNQQNLCDTRMTILVRLQSSLIGVT